MLLKKITAFFLSVVLSVGVIALPYASAEEQTGETDLEKNEEDADVSDSYVGPETLDFDCKSAVLMEAETGRILYAKNPDEALPPASVTKVMTLLLVMEAVDSGKIKLDDMVTASEHAASMGGSQIYLKVGEQMSVEDMIKSVVISSANDAACALAEFVSGSEESFVKAMNARAKELGMENTNFENTNGLDDTAQNHVISAKDIAIMSRELIKHPKILEYSSIWMDTIRDGAFGLTNTNRLVRFYKGCTGLKTGSTSKAGFCISATAERDGMSLICVIMGAPTRDVRNAAATSLLDWGFANYGKFSYAGGEFENIKVIGGVSDSIKAKHDMFSCILEKDGLSKVQFNIELPENISAPVKSGDVIGKVVFTLDGREIGKVDIYAAENVDKISFLGLWYRMIAGALR